MLTTRILLVLLAVVLAVVVIGYMTGAIGNGSDMDLSFGSSSTPVPTVTPNVATPETPDVSESLTPVPTWETIPISSQINEIVTPTPMATFVTTVPTEAVTASVYYVHMDDTMKYNTSTSRMFDVNVGQAPFIVYFSFNPGMVKKSYVSKVPTSSSTVRYETWLFSPVESRYVVKSTNVIDPNAWFKVDIIRVYDDSESYNAAVSAAGGKEKLAEKKLLYGDNGIIIMQDGYARGYSSEVEKELKLFSPGHYLVKVTGNQIVANIQMLSP